MGNEPSPPSANASSLGALFVRDESDPPRTVRLLPGDELVVGSSASASLQIVSPRVASRHCTLRHAGTHVDLVDLGSDAGTWVFGARVPSAELWPPASIELGARGPLLEIVRASCRAIGASDEPLPGVVGRSEVMLDLASRVRRFAAVKLPVLVRGESGVGKDLVARALHSLGPRKTRPFVIINAATISRELAESELFGHHRGAFTGAVSDRRGAFREAHGGTLFIDEIGSLGPEIQAKLLRVVEDGEVRPLGGEVRFPVDVRLVAATCEPLEQMVDDGRFREDLYERLAVCVASVPPLHERPDDIPAIARALLVASGFDARITSSAMGVLVTRRYRGNVRELRNILVQSVLRSQLGTIESGDVQAVIAERSAARRRLSPVEAMHVLEACDGNFSRAARTVNMPRSTLRGLIERAQNRPVSPP
jgi:DNA-binding NtrC family response regulator